MRWFPPTHLNLHKEMDDLLEAYIWCMWRSWYMYYVCIYHKDLKSKWNSNLWIVPDCLFKIKLCECKIYFRGLRMTNITKLLQNSLIKLLNYLVSKKKCLWIWLQTFSPTKMFSPWNVFTIISSSRKLKKRDFIGTEAESLQNYTWVILLL